MRARLPDQTGFVERDGVRTYYEVHGDGPDTIYVLPTFSIVHIQYAKTLIPSLARHYRVVTSDPRGNGRSDRPVTPEENDGWSVARDVLDVMDATGTDRALLVGLSRGTTTALLVNVLAPERIAGLVLSGSGLPAFCELGDDFMAAFEASYVAPTGPELFSRQGLSEHYRSYLEWFFAEQVITEPHSLAAVRDSVEYGLSAAQESIVACAGGLVAEARAAWAVADRVRCPTLVHHGSDDVIPICPVSNAGRLAEATGGELVITEGGGHASLTRDPVFGVRMITDFARRVFPHRNSPPRSWTRATATRSALFMATALGLGHIRRDVAVAAELRKHHPDLQIQWLCQHPASLVLEAAGECVHPASRLLANESAHVEEHGHEHNLAVFDAFTRMHEILVNNYLVFDEVIDAEPVDLVVADEGWDVDIHLHENPERKRFAYAWMADWVGFVPMPEHGPHEARWTEDYNTQLVEHRERFKRIRDASIFVGTAADIPDLPLGPGLPSMRAFADRWFTHAGYVTGYAPPADRDALRATLGFEPDEQVCVVAVGGTGVGEALLRRVVASLPAARKLVPDLRMIAVCGPRIDPSSLLDGSDHAGLDVHAYVPSLYRHLHACDLAIVQGGLTTTMECAAAGTPFLYFPLVGHFEQQILVRHRLDRHHAGRCMDYTAANPETIAMAIAAEIGRPTSYLPVETDGAARAASLLAELL